MVLPWGSGIIHSGSWAGVDYGVLSPVLQVRLKPGGVRRTANKSVPQLAIEWQNGTYLLISPEFPRGAVMRFSARPLRWLPPLILLLSTAACMAAQDAKSESRWRADGLTATSRLLAQAHCTSPYKGVPVNEVAAALIERC